METTQTGELEPETEEIPSDKVADLVEYIVCGLVDNEDSVSLDVTDSEEGALIEVTCSEEDAGRVIGRKGRTIKAMKEAFGTRADLPARAGTMLRHRDTVFSTPHRLALGDPQLLTSTRRKMLVEWREKSDLLLSLSRQADGEQR